MQAPFSPYLCSIAGGIRQLMERFYQDFDDVSILCTDSVGFAARVSRQVTTLSHETMTTERGMVVRVWKNGRYSEAAFNCFDPQDPDRTYAEILPVLQAQFLLLEKTGTPTYETGHAEDTPCQLYTEMETGRLPEDEDLSALLQSLKSISQKGLSMDPHLVDVQISAQSTHVCKMFLTRNRDMRQSYVYSEGAISCVGSLNGRMEMSYQGVSGRKGPELFAALDDLLPQVVKIVQELLTSERITPGEYDIITSPEVTGLIAHEAFGHGVEMDMFVKHRALGAEYIGQRVGSDLVSMHEGALCATDVTSYAFDDEGTLAGDVTEIDHGILRTGICDALSALRLGCAPTGNGKRQNFEHKVYTRMTNTIFDSGTSTLEEMIRSIDYGFYLCGMQSGMEDPKHWGIQCIVERAYEIRNGQLTGKVMSPIVLTGYVPDLLSSISMVSRDREVFGNGGCGKGHKEWVKVADGGPYLKAKARLG
ncbi:MAG: TldD/PmbA family protein [Clostridia bacterium]|nr:TldD/PmbA family protein [Clostridia bacterium]